MPMSERLDKAILAGLAVAIVFTSLARGAVEPWYMAAFELHVTALAVLFALKAAKDPSRRLHIPAPIWPMVGLLAFGLVQSVAWTDSAGNRASLSLDVEATRSTVLALIALIVVTVIVANVLNSRERLGRAAHFLTFYGLAMAVFAIARFFILSIYNDTPDWAVQGMFVNHNHFAGHMELLLPVPLALVITNAVPGRRALFAFAAAVIGVATVASLSRGGMMSVGAELLFLLAASLTLKLSPPARREGESREQRDSLLSLILWRMGLRRASSPGSGSSAPLTAGLILLLAVVIIGGTFWLDRESLVERVMRNKVVSGDPRGETLSSSRGWLWQETLDMFRARPLLGSGLGAYATAYSHHSREDRGFAPEQSHGDYLQILADAGLIGGALAACFIVLAARNIARSLHARDPLAAGVALACGAGFVGMLVHSVFDFNLQLPSNSLLFLLLTAASSRIGLMLAARRAEDVIGSEDVAGSQVARAYR
jgi:O-antigen ligase